MWIAFGVLVVLAVIAFAMIAWGWIGYMPPIEDMENPKDKFASEIYSSDMEVLGRFYQSKSNRVYVHYDEISPYLVNALIATEDIRFKDHSGIDVKALFRAFIKRGLLFQKSAGGGSTITQQLAKLLYSPSADNIVERLFQKPQEWVIAVQLERFYTKEEIVNMYLNHFDFLNNAVGIQSAAYIYFHTTPDKLKIEEAATLVGMCKNPSYYNPRRFNERTRGRRNTVLDQMYKAKYITKAERDSLQALPLELHYTRVDHKEGVGSLFQRAAAVDDDCQEARAVGLSRLGSATVCRRLHRLGHQSAVWLVREEPQGRRLEIQHLYRRTQNLYHHRLAHAALCRGRLSRSTWVTTCNPASLPRRRVAATLPSPAALPRRSGRPFSTGP